MSVPEKDTHWLRQVKPGRGAKDLTDHSQCLTVALGRTCSADHKPEIEESASW